MRNQHDTEDMVQNTFIRLMRDNTLFQSEEHEKAWLIRTATNVCKDFFRNRWRKVLSLEKVADVTEKDGPIIDETLKLVMDLPNKYKTVVYMYYYEGYSSVEIAEILKKNESTIRGYLSTARKLLKIQMEGDFE